MNNTLKYYNEKADEYIQKSHSLDMKETLDNFLSQIPNNSHILEIGTGSGRDAIYFSNKGHRVTTIEPSPVLAEKAQANIQNESTKSQLVDVIVSSWQDFKPTEQYDAIYAMASLLHLPKSEIKDAFKKCIDSLADNGHLFVSLKSGVGEAADNMGRNFSYYEIQELKDILKDITQESNLSVGSDKKDDLLGRTDTQWINIEYKKPKLKLNNDASPSNKITP